MSAPRRASLSTLSQTADLLLHSGSQSNIHRDPAKGTHSQSQLDGDKVCLAFSLTADAARHDMHAVCDLCDTDCMRKPCRNDMVLEILFPYAPGAQ